MYRLVRRASLSGSSGVISALPAYIHLEGLPVSVWEATRCSDTSARHESLL